MWVRTRGGARGGSSVPAAGLPHTRGGQGGDRGDAHQQAGGRAAAARGGPGRLGGRLGRAGLRDLLPAAVLRVAQMAQSSAALL